MLDSKFSVVIPTMWRHAPFVDFLKQLVEVDLVDEIILVDNDNTKTPNDAVLQHSKIKFYDFGGNTFVNPVWNFGVHVSKNKKVCIANDDVSFDLAMFDRVAPVLTAQTGVMGLCPGLAEFNQPAYTNGAIDIIPWTGQHTFGFGCLMFVHKDTWVDIPDTLDIYYGDNWIFDIALQRGRTNYMIANVDYNTPYASTTKEIGNNTILEKETLAYNAAFDAYKNNICFESITKHNLDKEHIANQPQRITVVVPTMWRHAPFLDFVQDFLELKVIERIIIVNNDESKTPHHPVLRDPKVTMVGFGHNIFVNPAWNLGVNTSTTDIVAILNDDLTFDIRLFNRVAKFLKPEMGALGLSNGIVEYGQTPLTTGTIEFEPFVDQAAFGFGNLMFVHKKHWCDIPQGLDIFFGDNWIFDWNYFNQRTNYLIVNLFHHHAASTTVNEITETGANISFYNREKLIYDDVKAKLINKTY